MAYGKNIREARERLGLSQTQLAKRIGVSRPTIHNWEDEEHAVTKKHAPKLAKVLGLPMEALNPHSGSGVVFLERGHPIGSVVLIQWSDLKRIAGGRSVMSAVAKASFIQTDTDYAEDCFAVRVDDQSMEPAFRVGEIVIVDPKINPQKNDAVIARLDKGDEHVLRYYIPRRCGAFDLQAENPNWHTVTINAKTTAQILGVVVEHRKKRHPG